MNAEPNTSPRLRYQLIAATLARMVVNTGHRMFYPFLPVFSRGLGVPVETLTTMLSIRGALGMAAPLFGPTADRLGRRTAMLIGLAAFCGGLAIVAVSPSLASLFAAVMLIVVCKFIFDPALQAYLSERTPYSRRGLVIALTEFAWSGAVLVGVPLVGFLMARSDWRAPFLPLMVSGLLAGLWIALLIPADTPRPEHATEVTAGRWLAILRNPSTFAALSIGLTVSAGNEILGVVYGVWMEQSFSLSVVQLGLTTTVIGVAELIGEGGVAALSDRLGKPQTIALGLAFSALSYVVLPAVSLNIQRALAGIFFVYLAFEFAIVASIPLVTELVPDARSTVMSTSVAFHAAGRMIGALIGGYVYRFGFLWNAVAAGLVTAVGIPLVLWVIRERK